MQNIANYIEPYKDELFISWLNRLAIVNGFENPEAFCDSYQIKTTNDFIKDIPEFCRALQNHLSPYDLVLKMSLFPLMFPFCSDVQQNKYFCLMFQPDTPLLPMPTGPYASKLVYCPKCQKDDLSKNTTPYLRRLHHMPAISICPTHGCHLRYVATDEEVPSKVPANVEKIYADFLSDFSDTWLHCHYYAVTVAIRNRMAELGYSFDKLICELKEAGFSNLFSNVDKFVIYKSVKKLRPLLELLAVCAFLFRDKTTFLKYIDYDYNEIIDEINKETEYSIIQSFDDSLLLLEHKACGHCFYTTPALYKSGWRCPNCDSSTATGLFKQILERTAPEYELLDDINGLTKKVHIRHNKCGEIIYVRPSAFIYEKVRCRCEYYYTHKEIAALVSDAGPYELISEYEGYDNTVEIHAKPCGHTFTVRVGKFLKSPYCRVCHPRVTDSDSFAAEIKSLVGDEYVLLSDYKDRKTPATLCHIPCGNVYKVAPKHFVEGSRCPNCIGKLTVEQFKSYVNDLSSGRYEVLSVDTTSSRVELLDTKRNEILTYTKSFILQELQRPTPSSSLPHEYIGPVIPTYRSYDKILNYVRKNYTPDMCIFAFDFLDEPHYYPLKKLVSNGHLKQLIPGVFAYPEATLNNEDIVHQFYIERNKQMIGYYAAETFLHRLGYYKNPHKYLQIVSNRGPLGAHRTKMAGISIKVKRGRCEITEDNCFSLPIFEILFNWRKYLIGTDDELFELLAGYCRQHNLSDINFTPYQSYYPGYTEKKLHQLLSYVKKGE